MITYHYDLISGKVNMVSYNPGKADQFFHQYDYDAENRLRAVKTSADGWVWEVDATYDYYRHGPLARTELGDLKVQGLDYAYSLQGWLKGVNSTSLYQGAFDMGGDGKAGGIHQYTARDAMGFSLTYFGDDYRPVGPGAEPFAEFSSKLPANQFKPLYNGNITAMAVNISGLNGAQLYNYQYDQLNRLTGMDSYQQFTPSSNQWTSPLTTQQAYKERIAYDGNGNILQYLRQGMATKLAMDSLQYTYNYSATGQLLHNQLNHIRDNVSGAAYAEDIDDQPLHNYRYDAIGNLLSDSAEGISSIDWTVYGKIQQITRRNGTRISYSYDAAGNRISKSVQGTDSTTQTWYVRDGSGNVMSIYVSRALNGSIGSVLRQTEVHLYGSSRLGILKRAVDVVSSYSIPSQFSVVRGNKFFELSNHLGNVLATVSDKKTGHDAGGGTIDYYEADIVSASDYAPFGMQLAGRTFNTGEYRYGFQSQETDKELWGGAIAFEYRVEDPRLGRFFSVDPLSDDYPWNSPYAFAENRVIDGVELEGLEWKPTKDKQGEVSGYTWAGYNRDGSAVEGTVARGIVYNKNKGYNTWYSSDKETRSGSVDFMSAGSKEYLNYNEMPNPTGVNKYNVTINYKDNWKTVSSLFGTYRKEVTVDAELWTENGAAKTEATTFNNNMGISSKVYDDPKKFFNSFRYSLGYADGPTSGALIPVYPETLLMPLPKGLNILGKATGGTKQWFRLGESYSKAGKFHTYGLRWGASPKYANKIGSITLRQLNQDFRKTTIPFKSWRTADPGHLHFWKLK